MHDRLKKVFAVLVVAAGLILTLYPWVSNRLFEHATESTAGGYEAVVDSSSAEELAVYRAEAEAYNTKLLASEVALTDPFTEKYLAAEYDVEYEDVLDTDGSGIMCFIEIPKINVYLPVYHGTSSDVLSKGAGHVEGTALPIGTAGGRPIISAHTGINSAKMFSDLVDMEEGDLFFIHVLDEILAYRVFDIQVIEPDDVSSVTAQEDLDLMTLMTCTPYGVNSHRLIVTGERTEYTEDLQAEADRQESDSSSAWMKAYREALIIALSAIGCIVVFVRCVRLFRKKKWRIPEENSIDEKQGQDEVRK